jgi:tRNA dimethylallyltransferase
MNELIPPDTFREALVLTGPTASGKSALGVRLAGALGAEIISLDSMAVYRGMDIGTAKPTVQERQGIHHHLMDVLDPWESATVAWWLREAARCCRDIQERGRRVLFIGGTPFYLKAMLLGLFEGPPGNMELRGQLEAQAQAVGPELLHRRLAAVDPEAAARLHPNDRRRVVRALEVWELTGQPLSRWQQQWSRPAPVHGPRCWWLDLPRAQLYERINARVDRMFASGLVEEVEALCSLPRPLSREARQALGYKEVLDHLDGKVQLADTVERVKLHSRNFAKRQITWFRHLPGCRPVRQELTLSEWASRMEGVMCGE